MRREDLAASGVIVVPPRLLVFRKQARFHHVAGDGHEGERVETEEAAAIAAATGFIGPCRDYLFDTVDALRANGIKDPHLENLAKQVKLRLATDGGVG